MSTLTRQFLEHIHNCGPEDRVTILEALGMHSREIREGKRIFFVWTTERDEWEDKILGRFGKDGKLRLSPEEIHLLLGESWDGDEKRLEILLERIGLERMVVRRGKSILWGWGRDDDGSRSETAR